MNELFTVVSPRDALATLLTAVRPLGRTEPVALADAAGRVLAHDVVARAAVPAFPRAMMDGFAVRASDTYGASETAPAYLRLAGEVLMGTTSPRALGPGEAMRIHTGAMLPDGADAVVMVEDTAEHGDEVEIRAAAADGENALRPGEDVEAGALALRAGTRLDAAALGGLAALGIVAPPVVARPRVAVLSTGDEVVPVAAEPVAGQVRDVNGATVAAVVAAAGGVPIHGGIVADDPAALEVRAAALLAEADALVVSAGSSVSYRDVTARVVARLGAPGILAHGIAIRPGKPTILAVCYGKPVIGLPGNPASALVVARRIVRPLVRALGGEAGVGTEPDDALDAVTAADVPSRPGREEYVPCRLDRSVDPPRAQPLFGESNLIFTLVRSDGLLVVPFDRSGLRAGERVRVLVR